MQSIPVFYQMENHAHVEHVNFSPDNTLADVLNAIRAKHGTDAASHLFLEDADEPADLRKRLQDLGESKGVKVHVHRCKRIEVSVAFNGTKQRTFPPAATVARVKRWVTDAFNMSPEDAGEHVLQLAGTTDRPSPGTHLGSLATHPHCHVRFDLVPNERVNGAPVSPR
jgi:hypothetical protein